MKAYVAKYHEQPGEFSSYRYGALMVIVQAIKAEKSDSPNPAAIARSNAASAVAADVRRTPTRSGAVSSGC